MPILLLSNLLGKKEGKEKGVKTREKKTPRACIPDFVLDLIKDIFLIAYFQKLARNVQSESERFVKSYLSSHLSSYLTLTFFPEIVC